jgi:integrase
MRKQGRLMPAHRSHGDGGLYYDNDRKRWTAEITIGYGPNGKRIVRKARSATKTAAQRKLKEMLRDHEDGLAVGPQNFTVGNAVRDWLEFGLTGRDPGTANKCRILANKHIIPELGARKLRELSADDIDRWLAAKAKSLSTDTLRQLRSILKRAVTRAQARDKVKRNVVLLCDVPAGRPGRPSKAFNLDQAEAVLDASSGTTMYAYIVLSILIGARTEELRALTWDHVDLEGSPTANPPIPPSIMVWRSVRAGGDTKTRQSRRTLALPVRCVEALAFHRHYQDRQRNTAGPRWHEHGLVFASTTGTQRNANNVLRSFRAVLTQAQLDGAEWTPREMRHSFVSLLSDSGVPIEHIARLVGHAGGSEVTETVYRQHIRPVLLEGAEVTDRIFSRHQG